MFTIEDYLKYYKNITIDKVHFNVMDNLLCSILSYLALVPFEGCKTLKELYEYSKYNKLETASAMAPVALKILDLVVDSKRYTDLLIYNLVNIKNDVTQFGAVTFRINDNMIIAYKGTDGSLIGWMENIRIGYDYPTYTQRLAIDYLNNNINLFNYKDLYIVGHSKGGNLAMVSAMESNNFDKITKVYNFDGPGFRIDEYNSSKYNKLSNKLVNILPTGSVVGTLLYNNNYTVVKSNKLAFEEHYPNSWNMYGEFFLEGKLSKVSMQVHECTTEGINTLEHKKVEEAFETIFKSFEKEYSSDVSMSFEDLIKFYRNMKKVDPEISKYIDKILNCMLKESID